MSLLDIPLLSKTQSLIGEMYIYENTTATSIGTKNVYHALGAAHVFDAGICKGFSVVAGGEGTGSITDYSGTVAGTVLLTSVAHGRTTGDILTIHESTDYDGTVIVTVVDVDTFYFTATYGVNRTASWATGTYLLCGDNAGGYYRLTHGCSVKTANPAELYKAELNVNLIGMDKGGAEHTLQITSDIVDLSRSFFYALSKGDRVWYSIKNETSSANLTLVHANITVEKIRNL